VNEFLYAISVGGLCCCFWLSPESQCGEAEPLIDGPDQREEFGSTHKNV